MAFDFDHGIDFNRTTLSPELSLQPENRFSRPGTLGMSGPMLGTPLGTPFLREPQGFNTNNSYVRSCCIFTVSPCISL